MISLIVKGDFFRKNLQWFFLFAALFIPVLLQAQNQSGVIDSVRTIPNVVITGFRSESTSQSSLNIESFYMEKINEKISFNLSDALTTIPGISQMSTGNGISKPVIRGLYGNRILVLLSGMRFDNQQWQDEHGLGLSQIGIQRVEIIKGPASLLYGSEAMGGVINIIEEKLESEGFSGDASVTGFSNSAGVMAQAGVIHSVKSKWWRLRVAGESHADYSDGDGSRVLNSRFGGYYLKAGFGFNKGKWLQDNSYNFSYNQFGFILDDLTSFFTADDRWNRMMNGPHHIVMLNILNSSNTFTFKNSLLNVKFGLQSNSRKEDEGGGQISLNMHLLSVLQNAKWDKALNKNWDLVVNQQLTFTNNTNYGGRIIIPDANLVEGNVSGYLKKKWSKLILEIGGGVNYKFIETFQTATLNIQGSGILPFTRSDVTGNAMGGLVYQPVKSLLIKLNSATGFRAPNLAELSSNGVHEGVYRYEIGNPELKNEQNINSDLSFDYTYKSFETGISVYYNRFLNYIYLQPTEALIYNFPVYRFVQDDASIYGMEYNFQVSPAFLKMVQLKESFAATVGETDHSGNLPFIPAFKVTSAIRLEKKFRNNSNHFFVEPEWIAVLEQDVPALFETKTPAYNLFNLNAGLSLTCGKNHFMEYSLNIDNLTNESYYDHLSRLKYYGLYNQGINFVGSVKYKF